MKLFALNHAQNNVLNVMKPMIVTNVQITLH